MRSKRIVLLSVPLLIVVLAACNSPDVDLIPRWNESNWNYTIWN